MTTPAPRRGRQVSPETRALARAALARSAPVLTVNVSGSVTTEQDLLRALRNLELKQTSMNRRRPA